MKKTLDFLKKIKSNNKREWFEKHRPEFLEVKAEFEEMMQEVLQGIRKFDKAIEKDTSAADYIFRIYRDVRFSKNKMPYKHHMGASINPGGRKSPVAGYYLHIQPGGSFVAGGIWQPESAVLKAIRQEIDYHPAPLLKLMKAPTFKKYYKGLDEEDKLQTVPKGYGKDHPHIELLKNRHFLVSHSFTDKTVLQKDFAKEVARAFAAMYPLMQYLREAAGNAAQG
jgi:uncharacterized protein (TIGR02453 family)